MVYLYMLAIFILVGIFAHYEALGDYVTHKNGQKIDHVRGFIRRGLLLFLVMWVSLVTINLPFYLMLGSLFYLVFTPSINRYLGVSWYYLGDTSKLDILLQKIFGNDSKVPYFLVVAFFIAMSILFFVK